VGEALTALWAVRDADGDVFAARKVAGATDEPGDRRLTEYREVARQAMSIGSKLGVPDARLKTLYIAGLFHDLGLAGVPHELTTGGRRLTDEERRVVGQHPLTGARMMRQSSRLREAAEIVRHLGEHYDGTGIPEGLSGTSIPLESRILAAVVAYSSLDADTAPLVLRAARGTQFDPHVVDAVLESSPVLAPALA
jgi:response regulator RpfG family c-di-GMP phosphodiesterase